MALVKQPRLPRGFEKPVGVIAAFGRERVSGGPAREISRRPGCERGREGAPRFVRGRRASLPVNNRQKGSDGERQTYIESADGTMTRVGTVHGAVGW